MSIKARIMFSLYLFSILFCNITLLKGLLKNFMDKKINIATSKKALIIYRYQLENKLSLLKYPEIGAANVISKTV